MKKILAIIITALLPILLSFGILAPNYIGNYDINQMVLLNCSEHLSSEKDRFISEIRSKNSDYSNWNYMDIYNLDFYNKRFSVAFRISAEKYTISDSNNNPLLLTEFSDIIQCSLENNKNQNMSGLLINANMSDFTDESIVLSSRIQKENGLNVGDVVKLAGPNGTVQELTIFAFYDNENTTDFTDNVYLNKSYYDFNNGVSFVSRSVFTEFLGCGSHYNVFLSMGKEKERATACYRELKPFLDVNSADITIPSFFALNNKTIDGISFENYSSHLKKTYEPKKTICLFLIHFIPIIGLLICMLCYFFVVPYLTAALTKLNPKLQRLFAFIYILYIVGINVLSSFIMVNLIPGNQNFSGILSFNTSLRWLIGTSILSTFILLLSIVSSLYFNSKIEAYKNSKSCLDDFFEKDIVSESTLLKKNKVKESCQDIVSKDNNVLFFGSFTSPTGSAGACRTLYLAKMFSKIGFNSIISSHTSEDKLDDYEYDGVYFMPYALRPKKITEKAELFLSSRKGIKKIISNFKNVKPKMIVIYSVLPIPAVVYLKNYCKKNNVRLIFDVVESQVLSQQSFSSFIAYYLPQLFINNIAIDKTTQVISISSFLCDKFSRKGIDNILIPFVSDTDGTNDCTNSNNRNLKTCKDAKYVLYAGNPFKKRDLLSPVFSAINNLNSEEKKHIKLIIAGVDEKQLLRREGVKSEDLMATKDNILVLGKVPHNMIENLYLACDFSILVKPLKKRFSKAGFPTKVSESMAHGVPAICNLSSDLQQYLNEGNSIIINGDTVSDIAEAFKKIIYMDDDIYAKMKKSARATSKKSLDVSSYVNVLNDFVAK